jgi:hypothetical protein
MERWFNRAMEADPDCWSACLAKREWLQPKWHGQDRDVYFFCQRCLYTRNWYAGLPFIAQQVYAGSQMNTDEDYRQYYGHETIWRYTQEAYTGFLAEYPTDRDARTRYAYIAARVGKWDVAAEQFEALGDVPWPGHFASREEFDRLRAEARKHARGK